MYNSNLKSGLLLSFVLTGLHRSHAHGLTLFQAFPKSFLRAILLFSRFARLNLPRYHRYSLSSFTRLGTPCSMFMGIRTLSTLWRLDVAQPWQGYTFIRRRENWENAIHFKKCK